MSLRHRFVPRMAASGPDLVPAAAGTFLVSASGSSPTLPVPADETSEPAEVGTASAKTHGWTLKRVAFWMLMAILAAFSITAGILTWRIIDTMNQVNSQSTPPAIVSGAVLGGSPEVQIDSGPARTAVANANATKTAVAANADNPPPTEAATETVIDPTAASHGNATDPTNTPEAPTKTVQSADVSDMPPPPDLSDTSTVEPQSTTSTPAEQTGTPAIMTSENESADPSVTSAPASETNTAIPPTEAPSVMATDIPEETATTAPVNTAPTMAESTGTATPAAVLSEIERLKNNSFEEGIDPWYIEPGVSVVQSADATDGQHVIEIAATGGFFDQRVFSVPGTEYSLTISARISEPGESAEFGVIYLNEASERLRDREPAPIRVTSTGFSTYVLTFTLPEDIAAIKIYGYKDDSGTGTLQVDTTSLRSIVPPLVEGGNAGDPVELSDGAMTILFMGVDAREGEAIDGEVRPDSLMIVHLNPESNSCRILSIPRDTRVELPGYGQSKINHALAVGGIEYQIEVVTQFTGVPIDHYVLIDFNGFQDLVDAIGGVTINVPEDFVAINNTAFYAGEQKMTGEQALTYARHRGDSEGDFGRIERQQQVIRALIREANGLDIVTSINELLPAVSNNLRTDLSASQMIDIATTYKSICTEEAISMVHMEGEIATYDDPLLQMPLSYVVIDEAEVRRRVADLLAP